MTLRKDLMLANIALVWTIAAAAPAFAQAPAAPAGQAGPGATAAVAASGEAAPASRADEGEIVVTAQKRAENVQDVPISIAAYSGETLVKSNVVTVEDLGKLTSNFQAA